MTTFKELKAEVQGALGGIDTTTANLAVARGVNAGVQAAAFLFNPHQLQVSGTLTASAGSGSVSMSSLTGLLLINSVYSQSTGERVHRLRFTDLDMPWVPTSGRILFYSDRGGELYYRPKADETLLVYYLKRPDRLVDDTDEYPFDGHEEFVISFASAYAWGYVEEDESSQMWQRISDQVGLPDGLVKQLQDKINLLVNPRTGDEG